MARYRRRGRRNPSPPDLLSPIVKAPHLSGKLRVHETHETSQLLRILWSCQQVKMIRGKGKGIQSQTIHPLGSTQGADDDFIELVTGPQQETAV